MDARTLENNMNYLGMEKTARKILIDEKLAKAEDVAVMTCIEVCEKSLNTMKSFLVKRRILLLSRKKI